MIEVTKNVRAGGEDCHFCPCGELAAASCTDAHQQADGIWIESAERFGCLAHPVEPMIYFADGKAVTAREWEKSNG